MKAISLRRPSPRRRVVSGALLTVVLPALLTGCSEHIGRGFDWNRMRLQPRYDPYSANPMFADSSAMRTPPAGTISREAILANAPPPPVDLARGKSRFQIYCAVCHGDRADGVSLIASSMDDPKPPSLVSAAARALPPAQIFAVITQGLGRMPSFASELGATDRWQVIAYLGQLQRQEPVGPSDSTAAAPAHADSTP